MPTIMGYRKSYGDDWKRVFWPDTNFQHLLDFALKEGQIDHFQCELFEEFPSEFQSATGYNVHKDKSSANYTAYLYLCAFRTCGAVPVRGQSNYAGMDEVLDKLADDLRQLASDYSNLHPNFGLYTDRENVHIMLKEYVDELLRLGFSFTSVY